jgi:hypothetical protein
MIISFAFLVLFTYNYTAWSEKLQFTRRPHFNDFICCTSWAATHVSKKSCDLNNFRLCFKTCIENESRRHSFFLMSHAAKHDFGIIASADIR